MSTTSTARTVPDVRKEVVVSIGPAEAFDLFVADPMGWWPPAHCFVEERVALTFEPFPGGRYYETGADGREVAWGRLVEFEPGHGLVMTWRVGPHWQPLEDDNGASTIRVEFTPNDSGGTLVALTHADLHEHGEAAEAIHTALDGPSPGETLARFAELVARQG